MQKTCSFVMPCPGDMLPSTPAPVSLTETSILISYANNAETDIFRKFLDTEHCQLLEGALGSRWFCPGFLAAFQSVKDVVGMSLAAVLMTQTWTICFHFTSVRSWSAEHPKLKGSFQASKGQVLHGTEWKRCRLGPGD